MLSMLIGMGVLVLVGGMGLMMSRSAEAQAEERLAGLTGQRKPKHKKQKADLSGILRGRRRSTWAGRRSGPG